MGRFLVELMDFDVVGIAGPARKEIERLRAKKQVRLVLHKGARWNPDLFAVALENTIKWLQPANIEHVIWPEQTWNEQVYMAAQRLFPRSFKRMGNSFLDIIKSYNQQVSYEDWLFAEHYRHLPIHFRQLKVPKSDLDLLRYELMEILLKSRDWGELKSQPDQIYKNPTLQVFDNLMGDLTWVQEKGLYLMYFNASNESVVFEKISSEEALILDLFDEDLVLNETKILGLISAQSLGKYRSESEWVYLLNQIKNKGLLI